jgi:hypothetical protein
MNSSYFSQPEDPKNTLVWRYMNTDKFVEFIRHSALYLPRVKDFNDKKEGILTYAETRKLDEQESIEKSLVNSMRNRVYVSSWHINDYESYAMWKLYAGDEEGVAIQTTYKSLAVSAINPSPINKLMIGKVRYIDFKDTKLIDRPLSAKKERFMRKDKSFSFENEVRIITFLEKSNEECAYILLKVDLEKIIKKIYVNPSAPDWYYEAIKYLISTHSPSSMKDVLLNRVQAINLSYRLYK